MFCFHDDAKSGQMKIQSRGSTMAQKGSTMAQKGSTMAQKGSTMSKILRVFGGLYSVDQNRY